LLSPGTVAEDELADTASVIPPGVEVTVYPVTGEPPLLVGAVHLTVATPSPPVALMAVGVPGTEAEVLLVRP
jgi:hypothetical protein